MDLEYVMRNRKFVFPKPREYGHQVAVVRAGVRGWYTWPCLLAKNQQQALDLVRQINQYIIEGKPIGDDFGVCVTVMAFGKGYRITDGRVCSAYYDFEPGDRVRISGSIGFSNDIWGDSDTAVVVQRHGGMKYTVSRRGDHLQTGQSLWSHKGTIEILTEKQEFGVRRPEVEDEDGDIPF